MFQGWIVLGVLAAGVVGAFECFDQSDAPEMFKNCGGDRYASTSFSTRSSVLAQHGMVATSHPLATEIALDILKAGGNAVDASIAANAAQTLMEPSSCGIGGDLFAIVWDPKTEQLYGLNGSGRSSKTQTFDELLDALDGDPWIPTRGPFSVSIPGTISGWFELHRRFGTLPMSQILEKVIQYAEEGFPMAEVVGTAMKTTFDALRSTAAQADITANGRFPNNFDEWMRTWAANGETPATGEVFKNPNFASILRMIAREDGDDIFYRGEIARRIAEWAPSAGVPLTFDDMASHTASWVAPMNVSYRGWEVHEIPPNGQGIAALQMLNILEGFDLRDMGFLSADYLHAHIAAKQLAYADRAKFYADPDFNGLDYEYLLSKEYAAERRSLIDMDHAFTFVAAGNPFPNIPQLEKGDTIYLSTADQDGMMVSLIQSNYGGFGSGLVPTGMGFALQNRAALFSMFPEQYNSYEPNKRPFHTIIPAFVTKDGKPVMSFGLMGGAMQAQGHAQIITNMVDFGLNPQEAGDAARYYHTGSSEPTGYVMTDGGVTALESGISGEVREELERRGHVLGTSGSFGGHQAILWDEVNEVYWGASEMRKDGHAAGY